MRVLCGLLGVLVALAALPQAADAQSRSQSQSQNRTCRQVLPSDFRRIVNTRGQEIVYFRDPVRVLCTGDIRLEADSAVMNRAAASVELVGNVVYQDSTRRLQAGWANYLGRVEQLLARENVVLRDLEGGSVITGQDLNYLRETESRPLARMIVTGERPYAVIPPARQEDGRAEDGGAEDGGAEDGREEAASVGADSDPPQVTEVWADRMESRGQELFVAEGNVDLKRGDMVGKGGVVRFERADDRITLTDSAFVETEDYRLAGDRIDAHLRAEELREVRAEGSARLTSAELDVRSERVRIGFSEGELERLEAWNPDPSSGRARANARDFRLRADSIDAQADSLGIRELRAVGRAYGERDLVAEPAPAVDTSGSPPSPGDVPADSLAVASTAAASPPGPLPGVVARDWVQGDTILGFFAREPARVDEPEAPGPGASSDTTATVLERIVVVGGEDPALSLYRMTEEGAGAPAINFTKAQRITLFMERGEVARVEFEGPLEGLYLDPGEGTGP